MNIIAPGSILVPSRGTMFCKALLLLVSILIFGALTAKAQNTADVVGTVADQSGAAVPNATVTILNTATNLSRSMRTTSTGDYAFTLLPIGTYVVSVEATGFQKFQATSITVAAGDRPRIDARLTVGQQSTTVEVSGTQAPLLQTDSATVGGLVTTEATQNLPLNGRNVVNLVQMAPGANEGTQSSLGGGNRPDDRRQTSTVSANGQNDSSNNFLLDGMDNNERSIATTIVKPSVDSLEEVKVDTSSYGANLGRVGGAVVDMVTKSGTNEFHGDVFEFFRNDMFDAKSVFDNPQPGNPLAGRKGELRQNQFGGSFGGAIRKDKTFFFVDYEGLRIIRGQLQTAYIPTACELTGAGCPVASTTNGLAQGLPGNFSDLCTAGFVSGVCADPTQQIYVPTTNLKGGSSTPFLNNIIPSASQNSIGVNYAKLWPLLSSCTIASATAAGTAPACPFISSPNVTQKFHTADARIDQHFGQNDSFFGRYTVNNGDNYFPGAIPGVKFGNATVYGTAPAFAFGPNPTFPGSNYGRQQNVTIGWDHIFRPDLVLDTRTGISRYVSLSTSANSGIDANRLFGGPTNVNIPSIKGTDGLATMNFQQSPYSPLGDQFALPTDYWDTDYQYRAELTWIKGGHTVKFGGSLLRRDWTRLQQLGKPGFNFNPLETSFAGSGGNPLASSLIGFTQGRSEGVQLFPQYNRDWEVGAYTQDDWRVNHWLTLNLGLRYDVFTYFTEKYNHLSNFDVTNPGVVAGGQVLVAGQNGVSNTVNIPTQHNMFQPRLGFAATLGHNFVLRGGFGTSYYVSNTAGPSQMDNAPFTFNYNDSLSLSSPFPFPTADPTTQCLVAACGASNPGLYNNSGLNGGNNIAGQFQNAMIMMANVTLEKAFGNNDVSIGWVGEPGRHLPYQLPDANYPTPPGLVSAAKLNGTISGIPCGPLTTDGTVELPLIEPTPCSPYFATLPYVGGIGLLESIGSSSYNALNAVFTRRFGAGLTIQANYTYASALSNSPGTNACDQCGILLNDPRYDWGFSDFDVRHRIAVEADYQLPFGKSATGFLGGIAKGWQINGIYSFESGLPFTIDDNTTQMGVGGPGTPNRTDMLKTGSPTFHKSLSEWFDITRFVMQPYGFPGNAHRNQIFGPPEKRFDFSLFKDFLLTERTVLQFRAEFFNLTNTPNFGQPNNQLQAFSGPTQTVVKTDAASGTPVSVPVIGGVCSTPPCVATNAGGFGSVQSANTLYNPREIQFALKLSF